VTREEQGKTRVNRGKWEFSSPGEVAKLAHLPCLFPHAGTVIRWEHTQGVGRRGLQKATTIIAPGRTECWLVVAYLVSGCAVQGGTAS
jgi:hypothetical protein